MKKFLLVAGLCLTMINIQAQTDRYWKGYGGSDDISDGGTGFQETPVRVIKSLWCNHEVRMK